MEIKSKRSGIKYIITSKQIMLAGSYNNYPIYANTLQELHNIHPVIKFNSFHVVKYTIPTDQKTKEHEFTFRLLTRQPNSANDLDNLKMN